MKERKKKRKDELTEEKREKNENKSWYKKDIYMTASIKHQIFELKKYKI